MSRFPLLVDVSLLDGCVGFWCLLGLHANRRNTPAGAAPAIFRSEESFGCCRNKNFLFGGNIAAILYCALISIVHL